MSDSIVRIKTMRMAVWKVAYAVLIVSCAVYCVSANVGHALAQVSEGGDQNPDHTINYREAQPLPLPLAPHYTDEDFAKTMLDALRSDNSGPGASPREHSNGSAGKPIEQLPKNDFEDYLGEPLLNVQNEAYEKFDFGSANLPFSTARAVPDNQYPYRAVGKLFFLIDDKAKTCTASLIKRGVVVTAAHCVAEFGKNRYYSGWQFAPGYRNGAAPYGTWTAVKAAVLTSYLDGSDPCQTKGVICPNDIAVVALNPKTDASGNKSYPGDTTGWFSYGWDRSGFTSAGLAHITHLGYPGCLDNAGIMERNDAQGAMDDLRSSNAIIGSLMCDGSSGGPWLVNFGVSPGLTGTTSGLSPAANKVVGVTSWGSTINAVKWTGASPFLSSNIKPLVDTICKSYSDTCE